VNKTIELAEKILTYHLGNPILLYQRSETPYRHLPGSPKSSFYYYSNIKQQTAKKTHRQKKETDKKPQKAKEKQTNKQPGGDNTRQKHLKQKPKQKQ